MTTRFTAAALLSLLIPAAGFADNAPGVFPVPGTDSTIKFNGFVEMAYVYELRGGPGSTGEIYSNPAGIPLDGAPLTKQSPNSLGFTAVYSRFGFQTNTPSDVGAIGTRIEGDFNLNRQLQGGTFTNSSSFRIRHAYGTVGDWLLLGQTWSTFLDLAAYPDQQDENPVPNLAPLRAPMVRVSFPAGAFKVSLSAENPYANSLGGTGNPGFKYTIPDFVARLDIPTGDASFSIRGVTRQFKTPDPGSLSKQGFGGAVGAAVKLGGDTLVLDGSAGAGMGPFQSGSFADAVFVGRDIQLWTTYAAHVGFTHVWSSKFRSNLIGSGSWASDNSDIQAAQGAAYGGNNKTVYAGVANTYWVVAKNAWVGAEFWYNYRKTFADGLGHESRILLTSHYDFM